MKKKDLSKGEWKIMNICWRLGKSSARNIYDEMAAGERRSYQALNTMLERMVEKDFLKREKFGPIWLYEPALPRDGVVQSAIKGFFESVLDNRITPLLTYFSQKEKLKPEEVETLKKMIEDYREDENGNN